MKSLRLFIYGTRTVGSSAVLQYPQIPADGSPLSRLRADECGELHLAQLRRHSYRVIYLSELLSALQHWRGCRVSPVQNREALSIRSFSVVAEGDDNASSVYQGATSLLRSYLDMCTGLVRRTEIDAMIALYSSYCAASAPPSDP